jgi:hypothetical protein
MATGIKGLPIGLGGDAGFVWRARPGALPPAFHGELSGPLGLDRAPGPAGDEGSVLGAIISGRSRLSKGSGGATEWWVAKCSDRPHPENADWPATIEMRVGGETFVLTTNAIKHMAERMPAKARSLAADDWNRPWSGAAGLDFPLSSLAGALEKLAARLPNKARKHHEGLLVDEWELGVTTEATPWRVTHAVYKPE